MTDDSFLVVPPPWRLSLRCRPSGRVGVSFRIEKFVGRGSVESLRIHGPQHSHRRGKGKESRLASPGQLGKGLTIVAPSAPASALPPRPSPPAKQRFPKKSQPCEPPADQAPMRLARRRGQTPSLSGTARRPAGFRRAAVKSKFLAASNTKTYRAKSQQSNEPPLYRYRRAHPGARSHHCIQRRGSAEDAKPRL